MSSILTADRWNDAPLGALIDHIVATYHRPLPEALRRLRILARGGLARELDDRLAALGELLLEHTHREEELVFPWLRRSVQHGAGVLVTLLEHEHGDVVRQLAELRAMTSAPGASASGSRRALSSHLGALQVALVEHLRLESCVLFPRALVADESSP